MLQPGSHHVTYPLVGTGGGGGSYGPCSPSSSWAFFGSSGSAGSGCVAAAGSAGAVAFFVRAFATIRLLAPRAGGCGRCGKEHRRDGGRAAGRRATASPPAGVPEPRRREPLPVLLEAAPAFVRDYRGGRDD